MCPPNPLRAIRVLPLDTTRGRTVGSLPRTVARPRAKSTNHATVLCVYWAALWIAVLPRRPSRAPGRLVTGQVTGAHHGPGPPEGLARCARQWGVRKIAAAMSGHAGGMAHDGRRRADVHPRPVYCAATRRRPSRSRQRSTRWARLRCGGPVGDAVRAPCRSVSARARQAVRAPCGRSYSGCMIATAPTPSSGSSMINMSIVMSGSTCAWLRNASTLRPVSCSIACV